MTDRQSSTSPAAVLVPVLCAVAAGLVFLQAPGFAFTNWDDIQFIVENPCLQAVSLANLQRIFTPGGVPGEMIYIPFTYISFMLEHAAAGNLSRIVHSTNLALHVVNVLLVYGIVHELFKQRAAAAVAALVFAVHPLQAEAVAWGMGRKDLLAGCFALVSLWSYMQYRKKPRTLIYVFTAAACAAAMLSKPSVLILPLLYLLIDMSSGYMPTRKQLANKIPFFVLAVICYAVNSAMPSQDHGPGMTLWQGAGAVLVMANGWFARLALLSHPVPFYPWQLSHGTVQILFSAVTVAAVAIGVVTAIRAHKKRPLLFFAAAFTLVCFAPAIHILINRREFITADRYGYLPMLGIGMLLAVPVLRSPGRFRTVYVAAAALFLAVAGLHARRQAATWSDSISVWTPVVERSPDLVLARNNLGLAYLLKGDTATATAQFEAGLLRDPDSVPLNINMARLLFDSGRLLEAVTRLKHVLTVHPKNAVALRTMGDILMRMERVPDAIECYTRATVAMPQNAHGWNSLGSALLTSGRPTEAEDAFRTALNIMPRHPGIFFNLGIALEQQGRLDAAAMAYSEAVTLKEDHVDALYNLGNIYLHLNKAGLAEQCFLQLLRHNPGKVEALINLGGLYRMANQNEKAVDVYTRALALQSAHTPVIQHQLGQVFLQLERFAEALKMLEAAAAAGEQVDPAMIEQAGNKDKQ